MNTLNEMDAKEIKEILNKGWLTHDAMWFYSVYREYGIVTANRLNLESINNMAAIEIARLKKAAGFDKNSDFKSFKEFFSFFSWIFSVIKPDFMDFDYWSPETNVIKWRWNKCFAHDGVSKLGAIDKYECGIIERIRAWFNTLGIKYILTPEIKECLMHKNGYCEGEFRFEFED